MPDNQHLTPKKPSTIASITGILPCWYIPLHIVVVSLLMLAYFFITGFLLKFLLAFTYTLFLLAMLGKLLHTVSLNNPNLFVMPLHPEKFPSRLILYTIDVIKIYECSVSTASRKIKEARDHHNKRPHQDMSIKEFCEYFSIDYNETISILKLWQ